MSTTRRWHLVSYDIRSDARWRKAYRLLRGYGERIQYSVFRVRGSELQLARMRWELEQILEKEDALLVIPLCPTCAGRIHDRACEEGWADEDPSFKIVE